MMNYSVNITKIICVTEVKKSVHNRGPFDTDWGRNLKAEYQATNTLYFFKQIDKVKQIPADLLIREFPDKEIGCGSGSMCNALAQLRACKRASAIVGFQL